MDLKEAETTHNINDTFGPGTANKHILQWWFKKFSKETRACWPLEADNDQLRRLLKLILLWEVAKELNVGTSVAVQHLKQIGKVKKLDKWIPYELTENQKNHCFEVSSSLSIRLWRAMKRGFSPQLETTSSVFGLRSSKALPKATLALKKAMVTV